MVHQPLTDAVERMTNRDIEVAEVSGRTVEEVVSDLWLKPIGDLSSIYDDLYAQEA